MIEYNAYLKLIKNLDRERTPKEVLEECLIKRVSKISETLIKNEETKDKVLYTYYEDNKEDMDALLRLIKFVPKTVEQNREFLVQYLYKHIKGESK